MLCPRLEDRTVFWFVKNGPMSWPYLFFVLEHAKDLMETLWKPFFFHFGEDQDFRKNLRLAFFFGEGLNFSENSRCFWAKTFLLENTWALCPSSLRGAERRSLASDFLGVLGLEPCVLDSTSAKLLRKQCTLLPLSRLNHLQNLTPKCKILNVVWT